MVAMGTTKHIDGTDGNHPRYRLRTLISDKLVLKTNFRELELTLVDCLM